MSSCRFKSSTQRPASGTSSTQGPSFPRTWRIYFTAVSDTLIPRSFREALRFASTDFRWNVSSFRCFSGASTDQLLLDEHRDRDRDRDRDRGAIVRSLRRRNPLTSFTFRSKVERIPKPNRFINPWIKEGPSRQLPRDFPHPVVILFARTAPSREAGFLTTAGKEESA